MDSAVQFDSISDDNQALLDRVRQVLPLLADLARADALLFLKEQSHARVIFHARPHSIAPAHPHLLVGEVVTRESHPAIFDALEQNRTSRRVGESQGDAAHIQREIYPLRVGDGKSFGALVIDTHLLEVERMRRRSRVIQQVVRDLKLMATEGKPLGAERVTHFGEHDGLLFADAAGVIRYVSGVATNLYRSIGYTETLVGKPLTYLETSDAELAQEARETLRCVERAVEERGRQWIRKAIPIEETDALLWRRRGTRPAGVLLAVHDDTEARERARELQIKSTMIKEVHHRVKNDLQTVAALLRMQARRMETAEARGALGEAVNRILSIAVIHEFLSDQDSRIINVRDIAQRILNQMKVGVLDPARKIDLKVRGPNIYLTARQATSCALVINELIQNALEHGFDQRASGGTIALSFEDLGDRVLLKVHDDGRGLPADFDLTRVDSLGLRIVRMLVTDDLKGTIELQSDHGVSAVVSFPKIPLGGDEAWSEQE